MTKPLSERGAASRSAWAVLGLLLLGLGLSGCGKGAPGEAPPQNGKPAEPAPPPPPEPAPATEAAPQSASPGLQEKDRATDEAPASRQLAPPAVTPAKPDAKARPPAAPSKAAPGAARGGASRSALVDGQVNPQLLRQRLDDVVKQATPDCPSARDRKQAICDLAGQICQLVDRDPDVASVESYCDDARQRCSDAERRTAQRCK